MKNLIAFLVLILFGSTLSTSSSSCVGLCEGINGNGQVIKQERAISPFKSVSVSGSFEVVLIQGDQEALVIEADENLMEFITAEVNGNELVIGTEKNLRNYEELKVYITFKEIGSLDLSGAVDLYGEQRLKFNDLSIDASGATEITLELEAVSMTLILSGASEITFSGYCQELNVESSGASEMNAENLETDTTSLEISGAGELSVFVNDRLDVEVSGAASVRYKGNPESVNQVSSGAGSIRKID
jgi:hypothetical protein